MVSKKTSAVGNEKSAGKKGSGGNRKAASKTSTKSASSKKTGAAASGKAKSKSKTGGEAKRKSGGGPKSYQKLRNSIKMPSSVKSSPTTTSSPSKAGEGDGKEKSKSGRKGAKKAVGSAVEQPVKADRASAVLVKSSKVDAEVSKSKKDLPAGQASKCADFEGGKSGGGGGSAAKLVSSKPKSNLGGTPSAVKASSPLPKTAPKSLALPLVKSKCEGVKSTTVTSAAAAAPPMTLANDDGSLFSSSVQNDDSALALVMHTAHDDGPVKRDETEIFVPGKGELRSTQPEPPQH